MLWFVGKVYSEFQDYLQSNGIPYGLFADAAQKHRKLRPAQRTDIDFSDLGGLEAQLGAARAADVDAVAVAGYENYVLPAALIARYYGVPGPSPEAALAATDKVTMRERFAANCPELTPGFAEVGSWADIEQFMDSHGFPVMLKPANLMKSLLVTKNDSPPVLRRNFDGLARETARLYEKYGVSQQPRFIIEECVEGSMHTIAAFTEADGTPVIIPGVVDCTTAQDIGFDDNFLYSRSLPSLLDAQQAESLYAAASSGIKALSLSSCPAHVELILAAKGPKIIEIGARIGGYRTRLYEYGCGINLQKLAFDNAYGRSLAITEPRHRSIAAIELFPDGQGTFAGLHSRGTVEKLPSLRHLSVKPLPGRTIGRASQGYKAAAVIILGNEDPEQFQKDFDYVREHATIDLAPPPG